VKTLAIAIITTVALLLATATVQAEPVAGCTPTGEATGANQPGCTPGEPEEQEEAEESEYEEVGPGEYEEVGRAESQEVHLEDAPATGLPHPVRGARAVGGATAPAKTAVCRRASGATIRADSRRVRRLKGKRRRDAERRLDRALCR
jgi:hypothetical protein